MIVGEARRKSGIGLTDGAVGSAESTSASSGELKADQETIEEELSDQEPGPELDTSGLEEAKKATAQGNRSGLREDTVGQGNS